MAAPFQFQGMGGMGQGGMGQIGPQAMPPGMGMDPAQNNMPLQFNANKGKPPMAIEGGTPDLDAMNMGNMNNMKDGMMSSMGMMESGGDNSGGDMSGMNMMNMMGAYQPMMGGMSTEAANMAMMNAMGGYQSFSSYMQPGPPKPPIILKSCTLYPPPPNAPPPTTRERPPGCRTAFIGGLPENCTEDILTEVFENCGEIVSVRQSKKNFAHIRFSLQESVERALFVSGYRMKIEDKDDKPNTGRIHVDYAQARDDLYEWECQQRAMAREMRHRQRMEEERLKPPSPPPVVHFSDHEAATLLERIKADDTFLKSSQILVTWLERGDCNKRNANNFYAMVQSCNSHVRRLVNEKAQHDEELEQVKVTFQQRMEGIIKQMEQITKVFSASKKQKAWDHFSKAQRKNIDTWTKQAQDIRKSQESEYLRQRQEDEMDLSDDEEVAKKRKLESDGQMQFQMQLMKEENYQLKCQVEAFKNEAELLKQESSQTDDRSREVEALQQALQGMQQQLINARKESTAAQDELKAAKRDLKEAKQATTMALVDAAAARAASSASRTVSDDKTEAADGEEKPAVESLPVGSNVPNDRDSRIIGLISIFLHVHPFGASVDYIWSFLQRLSFTVRTSELEDLMEKAPGLFKQTVHGVGASIERKWVFVGYDPDNAI